MDRFEDLYRSESNYWWAIAHRRVIVCMLEMFLGAKTGIKLLDVGCGGGGLLEELGRFGASFGLDNNANAMNYWRAKKIKNTVLSQAQELPVRTASVDVLCAIELLEHLDDERIILSECNRALTKNGLLLVTVPAFGFLYNKHDEWLGHKRRYEMKKLEKLLLETGFGIKYATYFHAILLPALFLMGRFGRFSGQTKKEETVIELPGVLNRFFIWLLSLEIFLFRINVRLAFGTSLLAVAEKIK